MPATAPMARRALVALGLLLAVLLAAVPPVAAQQGAAAAPGAAVDYDAWSATAARAEEAVAARRASRAAFETLRGQIVDWRQRFLEAQQTNSARIDTIRRQLDALGPPPPEGESESVEIAARRAELNEQLNTLRAPVLAAEEAYARANGLINEIDAIIRDRQSRALVARGPSPLNPGHWPDAVTQITGAAGAVFREVATAWDNTLQRDAFKADLPKTLVLAALGLVLLLRGRNWAKRIGTTARRRLRRGRGVWEFVISLGQVVLPLAGLYALEEAIFASGLIGLRGTIIADGLSNWGATLLIGWWLAGRLFPEDDKQAAVNLPDRYRPWLRFDIVALSVLLVVRDILVRMGEAMDYTAATMAVAGFPVIVLSAFLLYRMARALRACVGEVFDAGQGDDDTAQEQNYRLRIISVLSRLAILVALAGPVMAAAGYTAAADMLVYPSILTLALFGAVMVLQQLVADLHILVTRDEETAGEALLPVVAGFLLTLAALPVASLIWGVRPASLLELWTQFREGFAFGNTRISPTDFLTFAIVFAIGYVLTRMVQGALRGSVLPKTKINAGGRNAIVSGMGYVGIFLAAVIAITATGIDLSSLAIVAGALSVGIGFGFAEHRLELRCGHHPADRAADRRGRHDRGRRPIWLCQIHLGALDPDRDVRPHRRHRAQCRFRQRHSHQLHPRQHRRPGDRAGGRGLWQRHPQGGADPARDRRGSSAGADEPGPNDSVPRIRAKLVRFRDSRDAARRELDDECAFRHEPRDRQAVRRGRHRDPVPAAGDLDPQRCRDH